MMPDADVWARRTEPKELPEWMDEPCTFEQFRDCVRDLEQVNRWTLGYRPTLEFLEQVVAGPRVRNTAPLRILDVGFGRGDGLRRIARWAKEHGVAVTLTGVDINPFAAQAAREVATNETPICWLTGDYRDVDEPFDIVLSALLTHHLASAEAAAFLAWMETHGRYGWFINDLERSRRAAAAFTVLARIARWHPFVQHDGPVSFRRAFRHEDWTRLLTVASIDPHVVTLQPWRPGRLCVGRLR